MRSGSQELKLFIATIVVRAHHVAILPRNDEIGRLQANPNPIEYDPLPSSINGASNCLTALMPNLARIRHLMWPHVTTRLACRWMHLH